MKEKEIMDLVDKIEDSKYVKVKEEDNLNKIFFSLKKS